MVNLFYRKTGSSVLEVSRCNGNFGVSVVQLEMWERSSEEREKSRHVAMDEKKKNN